MSIISEYKLSICSMKLLQLLFYYRGMTALQLTKMYYELDNPFPSQKTNIHNYLSKLKKQSLVTSKKLEDSIQPGSLYFLTGIGFEAVKEMLNIEVGFQGNGYILMSERTGYPTQSDLSYELYQPPRLQVSHHLLLIDLFSKLRLISSEEEVIDHRLSMYCSTKYIHNGVECKIRPDAQIILSSKETFWIEVDRSTENHLQLLAKFQNYRNYFDYLKRNDLPLPINGILIVTDTKQQEYGLRRRWTNILAAFLKQMHPFESEVRIVMTPLNKLEETLYFESNRSHLNRAAQHQLEQKLLTRGYQRVQPFIRKADKSLLYVIASNQNSYKLIYSRIINELDSSLYTSFHQFMNKINSIHKREEFKHLQYKGAEYFALYTRQTPYIPQFLPSDQTNDDTLKELKKLSQQIELIRLE
jgi:hypothetical protein